MEQYNGFYDDDGNLINTDLIPKPGLCLICRCNEINHKIENLLCSMTRYDQRNEQEFTCYRFEKKRL